MKKIQLFPAVAIIALLTVSSTVYATFADVSTQHKNYLAISYLQKNNIIGGYPDKTFQPDKNINRAELLKILVEGTGASPKSEKYRNCFPDVKTEWFARYVCYAKERGWVGGYPDGTFKPGQNVSDVESLKMMLSAYGIAVVNADTQPFSDVSLDVWFTGYVATAKSLNLLEETGKQFKPGKLRKRAGIAENIFRLIAIRETNSTKYDRTIAQRIFGEDLDTSSNQNEESGTLTLQSTSESSIAFEAGKNGQNIQTGTFTDVDVQAVLKNNHLSQLETLITINSLQTRIGGLTAHLLDPDFFDAPRFPTATFSSTSISHVGGSNYKVTGNMTIKNVTRSITFIVTLSNKTNLSFTYDLDRLYYGIGTSDDGIDQKVILNGSITLED